MTLTVKDWEAIYSLSVEDASGPTERAELTFIFK